jgi:type II secretory ATPase GspE/PulE/Tfp pilus assembly ATPase PilB-like protein
MEKGWLNSSRSPSGSVRVSESDLVKFLEDQGFEFGQDLVEALTAEQRDEAYRRARNRKTGVSDEAAPVEAMRTASDPAPNQTDQSNPTPLPPPTSPIETEPADSPPPITPVETEASKPQAGQICDAILADAVKHGAQAIHFTPHRDGLRLQLRIDGLLHDKPNFDRRLSDLMRREIIACLLNRADPDIAPGDLTLPRTVEFSRPVEGLQLQFRLSVLPTANGLRLVIHMPHDCDTLVLEDSARARLKELLRGDGLIVVASRRKIGRDQVLRALLAETDTDGRSVIVIEQHAGPKLDDATRVQIDQAAGLSCAAVLAGLEQQDADIIVLSELRDPATATAAFEAAHDGALVIAGINADSAPTAIDELLAMGMEPWPLGATLKAIVAQTAVRTICEHCDGGCDRCGDTGWSGRTVLSGVVFVEGELVDLIRTGGSSEQFARAAAQAGPGSLAHAAQNAVDLGVTTTAEVARLLGRN